MINVVHSNQPLMMTAIISQGGVKVDIRKIADFVIDGDDDRLTKERSIFQEKRACNG